MPNFKNEREKRKYYKKKEKEIIQQKKQLDKEVEEEYKRLYPKDHSDISNKLAKKMVEFFDILWPDDEEKIDKEYDELLTDAERKKLADSKKEEKMTIIKAAIFIFSFVAVLVTAGSIYMYLNRSEYEKVIKPMIKEYFLEHYNEEIDIKEHNFICYEVENEERKKEEKCTNLLISTANNERHILTVDGKYVGDDVNNDSFRQSYVADFENQFSDIGIVYDDAQLSYHGFYYEYQPYLDYIKILPVGLNYSEMVATNRITVEGKVLYQGELNIDRVKYFLQSFSDESIIYFIKLNQGLPKRLTMVTKRGAYEVDVSNSLRLSDSYITYYELDRTINGTSSCELKEVSTHGIQLSNNNRKYSYNKNDEWVFDYGKFFNFTYDRPKRDEPEKTHFYILKFSKNSFINKFIMFDGSRGRYRELDHEEYPMFVYMTLGDETYVIGDDSFGIALKTQKKEGFLCNLGLC